MKLYCEDKMSIAKVSKISGIPMSTVRGLLFKAGVLRTRTDAIRLAALNGELGSGRRGKTVVFSEKTKQRISESRQKWSQKNARGISLKPNGYLEITKGTNKGRSVHVVEMEKKIGRKLFANEVVHHIDGNKTNNDLNNLQLMTRSDHARLHQLGNHIKRKKYV